MALISKHPPVRHTTRLFAATAQGGATACPYISGDGVLRVGKRGRTR